LFAVFAIEAEQLPVVSFTTADGLAHNHIKNIRQDSRGFLWFATDEGLSRFDGYKFYNYRPADGLPHPWVNDFLETRDGEYWVAQLEPYSRTADSRIRPSPGSSLSFLDEQRVNIPPTVLHHDLRLVRTFAVRIFSWKDRLTEPLGSYHAYRQLRG
jgi:ligand-binding sensor domain-containing protein